MGDTDDLLRRFGVSSESVDKIRVGHGVVGKTSYVAGAAIIALGVAAYGLHDDWMRVCAAAAIAIIFLVYFIGILRFATKNPGAALLEGAELIQWRRMDMGVKGQSIVPPGRNVAALIEDESGK